MHAIDVEEAVILGALEGLTEFLPISSTGHLRIAQGMLGIPVDLPSVIGFTAVVQAGAIAALLLHFIRDLFRLGRAWGRGLVIREERRSRDYQLAWWLILATIPIVVAGVLLEGLITGPMTSLWVVAGSLLAGSALMWFAEHRARFERGERDIRMKDVLIVGTAQILALVFPGFSRPGATISTGLLLNLDRVTATRLSFMLSIPAMTAGAVYEVRDALGHPHLVMPLVVGTAVSFVVAYASVAWLLRFVTRHSFKGFAIYRVVVGLALIGLLTSGVLPG
ncbi:MAG TPA: undecaprenyl-diphosphate phosphatase [Pseudonocardiaceae bacterium]